MNARVEERTVRSVGGSTVVADDRLTIRRMLIITAGAATGLVLFVPRQQEADADAHEWIQVIWFALLGGIALVSPLFVIGRRMNGHRAGVGGMLLLTLGLGVLSLVPTTIADRIRGHAMAGFSIFCLAYCIPFVCLWYLAAAFAGGQLTVSFFGRGTPWVERFGVYLTLAAAPLGIWLLVDVYIDAFF